MISAEGRYCSNRVLMLTRVKKGCCHYLEAEGAVTVKKKKKKTPLRAFNQKHTFALCEKSELASIRLSVYDH